MLSNLTSSSNQQLDKKSALLVSSRLNRCFKALPIDISNILILGRWWIFTVSRGNREREKREMERAIPTDYKERFDNNVTDHRRPIDVNEAGVKRDDDCHVKGCQ